MLTSWLSWRWIFLVNIPIGVGRARHRAAEAARVERSRARPPRPDRAGDAHGRALLPDLRADRGQRRAGWSSGLIVGLLVGGAVLLVGVRRLAGARQPTDARPRAVPRPAFIGAQIAAFAISSSMFAMFLYLTLYLQNILGLSPLQAGLRFLPLTLDLVRRRADLRAADRARPDPRCCSAAGWRSSPSRCC